MRQKNEAKEDEKAVCPVSLFAAGPGCFQPGAADGKGRTLSCNTEALTADRPEGAVFTVEYTGKNRDKNVKVTSSGEGFEYFLKEREGRERARMTLRTPRGNVIIPVCRIPLFL